MHYTVEQLESMADDAIAKLESATDSANNLFTNMFDHIAELENESEELHRMNEDLELEINDY